MRSNKDLSAAFARVVSHLDGNRPAGFISADVDALREDHENRMRRARATLAETDRILAGASPRRRPAAATRRRSPAQERLAAKITALESRAATVALKVQIETLRQVLERSETSN